MDFPITVTDVQLSDDVPLVPDNSWRRHVGAFVSVRPVKRIDPDEKTYLGIFVGDLNFGFTASRDEVTGVLTVSRGDYGNPAIYVFDLKRIVMGYESWWGVIQSEEQLKKITNDDINDIWYVKALRELTEKADEEE